MDSYFVPEISDNVYWVGTKDWNRRMFDALIPLPQGTSYNAYLVKGDEKTALIDSVNPGFEKELEQKINQIHKIKDIDYVVMNHAEPDHSYSIPLIMEMAPDAMLVTTEKGAGMAQTYYNIPQDRIMPVKDGDTLNLGNRKLKFISAPWLHWPETMFTYLEENKVLFPCDFFGAHTAFGIYDGDVDDLMSLAKRYFGEIMMPFRKMGKKGLEKAQELSPAMIAPSHGPIYKNPERIFKAYSDWTAGNTREKAIVVYVSMWQSTQDMVMQMVETLQSEGIEVCLYNLENADIGDIAMDLVDSRAVVLGTPTVLGGMHPLALHAANLVKTLRPPLKYGAALSSYGWGGGALSQLQDVLGSTKIELVGAMGVKGPCTKDDTGKIIELGRELAGKIREG
ncbi:FprA family A-type flavoprotein [Methanohalophilus halophilus]|uniref:Flavorubredoxin n=1 Tax=Methanohalophilus halophilus TaxID=2177 RepID=A0A1L3Q083_9EURY|nr:FprA family A-type flavoprotein [Methanohalophilus halophilus]APH38276.1 MBL fold hydrolase [Methanohalophilus halophilus]RNI10856.1 FprA family A-type flavoprotein [Methanohalophilus halophilus]SDW00867.1 Flavorubredoxin [Methanohalophilus halophilus]